MSLNRWTSLPKMPTGRYNGGFGCGVARDDAGKLSVVVVGGYYDNVEIYSVEEETWATGMPHVGNYREVQSA